MRVMLRQYCWLVLVSLISSLRYISWKRGIACSHAAAGLYHAILADKLDTSAFSRQESLIRVIFHADRITNCDLLHGNETSLNKGVITIRRFDNEYSNRIDWDCHGKLLISLINSVINLHYNSHNRFECISGSFLQNYWKIFNGNKCIYSERIS